MTFNAPTECAPTIEVCPHLFIKGDWVVQCDRLLPWPIWSKDRQQAIEQRPTPFLVSCRENVAKNGIAAMPQNRHQMPFQKGNKFGRKFELGRSPNPGGRPKKRPVTERYETVLEEVVPEKQRVRLDLPKGDLGRRDRESHWRRLVSALRRYAPENKRT